MDKVGLWLDSSEREVLQNVLHLVSSYSFAGYGAVRENHTLSFNDPYTCWLGVSAGAPIDATDVDGTAVARVASATDVLTLQSLLALTRSVATSTGLTLESQEAHAIPVMACALTPPLAEAEGPVLTFALRGEHHRVALPHNASQAALLDPPPVFALALRWRHPARPTGWTNASLSEDERRMLFRFASEGCLRFVSHDMIGVLPQSLADVQRWPQILVATINGLHYAVTPTWTEDAFSGFELVSVGVSSPGEIMLSSLTTTLEGVSELVSALVANQRDNEVARASDIHQVSARLEEVLRDLATTRNRVLTSTVLAGVAAAASTYAMTDVKSK